MKIVLTCEHAGNEVPSQYLYLFKGSEEVLYTHRALDLGALDLCFALHEKIKEPIFYTTVTRLLVEANRTIDSPELFSEYSTVLSKNEKEEVIQKYYKPYREEVELLIQAHLANALTVLHFSVHTFTPVLNNHVRPVDVGVLFDPAHTQEAAFAGACRKALLKADPALTVSYNVPYSGTSDGLTTYLRGKFPQDKYLGIELEVNQKHYLSHETERWDNLKATIAAVLKGFKK